MIKSHEHSEKYDGFENAKSGGKAWFWRCFFRLWLPIVNLKVGRGWSETAGNPWNNTVRNNDHVPRGSGYSWPDETFGANNPGVVWQKSLRFKHWCIYHPGKPSTKNFDNGRLRLNSVTNANETTLLTASTCVPLIQMVTRYGRRVTANPIYFA